MLALVDGVSTAAMQPFQPGQTLLDSVDYLSIDSGDAASGLQPLAHVAQRDAKGSE